MLVIMMKLAEVVAEQVLRLMKNTNVFERSLLWAAFQWCLIIVAIAVTGESEVTNLSIFLFAVIAYNQVKSAWYEHKYVQKVGSEKAEKALYAQWLKNEAKKKQEQVEIQHGRQYGIADWEM